MIFSCGSGWLEGSLSRNYGDTQEHRFASSSRGGIVIVRE